jgi:hypothetical protein
MASETLPTAPPRRLSNAYQNWYRFSRNPTAVIGAAIVHPRHPRGAPRALDHPAIPSMSARW